MNQTFVCDLINHVSLWYMHDLRSWPGNQVNFTISEILFLFTSSVLLLNVRNETLIFFFWNAFNSDCICHFDCRNCLPGFVNWVSLSKFQVYFPSISGHSFISICFSEHSSGTWVHTGCRKKFLLILYTSRLHHTVFILFCFTVAAISASWKKFLLIL